jgi:hypothetical protein
MNSKPLRRLPRWTLRPSLRRVAAIGLVKQAPSGVPFRKGVGLIGVCIANNDRGEIIKLNISDPRYDEALNATNENDWLEFGPEITHNLALADARKLSHSYGQVIGKVVQDTTSGEAIGCATVSVRDTTKEIATKETFRRNLTDLAISVANVIT